MEWNDLKSQDNIEAFMKKFGYFHDACLKELKYISGMYVQENLSMQPINSQRKLRLIFQRQFKEPTAIEIEFDNLIRLNLEPFDEYYDGIIFQAYMGIRDDVIYWADSEDFSPEENSDCTWIAAKEAKWRIADDYVGKAEVYF